MSEQTRVAQGLVLLFTGDGKGKTTAALGMMLRAWGHGQRVCVIQFIKDEAGRWGEKLAAAELGIEWYTLGAGFVWQPDDDSVARDKARQGWALAQQRIADDACDLLVLDEFTYPLDFGWIATDEVIEWLRAHRPARLHLVITGRKAPAALLAYADLVTEMVKVKHPYDAGVPAQRGVEF